MRNSQERKLSKPFFAHIQDINDEKLEGKKKKKVMLSKKKFKADHENVEDFILEPKKRDQFEGGSDEEEEKEDLRYDENQDEGPAREIDAY